MRAKEDKWGHTRAHEGTREFTCTMKLTHTAMIDTWCATNATSSGLPSLMAHGSTNNRSLQM